MLFFFPRDVLDEILNLIESVSESFPTYPYLCIIIRTSKFSEFMSPAFEKTWELHFTLLHFQGQVKKMYLLEIRNHALRITQQRNPKTKSLRFSPKTR